MHEIDSHVNGVGLLNERLGVLGNSEVVLAKHGMYDVCFKGLIKLNPSKFARLQARRASNMQDHFRSWLRLVEVFLKRVGFYYRCHESWVARGTLK